MGVGGGVGGGACVGACVGISVCACVGVSVCVCVGGVGVTMCASICDVPQVLLLFVVRICVHVHARA